MEVQLGPNSHDEPNLLYKLQCKVKVFNTSNPLPNRGYNLVASVSKYGIVFIGVPDGKLAVYYLNQLIDKECNPPHMLVQLQEKPTHIAVSCDQELLAVTGGQLLVVYKVVDFQSQNVHPALSVKCDVNPSTFVSDLKWNPCIPDTIAVAFFDGILIVLQASNGQVKKAQTKARCLCWSPKGKQLVVGNSDGTLCQYKPDLSPMKLFPTPNLFQNSPVEALAVHWISTYQFAVVYGNAAGNSRPAVCIVNTPKGGQPACINYEDICYSMGTNRPWYYYLHGIAQWNVILCSSSNSMELATLGTADGANWLQWCQPDEARPELPLTDKKQENYPVGICFDTAAIHQLPWGENEKLPPMPMLLVVSQTGLLTIFNVINLNNQAPQICVPPQYLTLPPSAMISAVVEPVSSPPSAPTIAAASQAKPAQPLLPTPQPTQPVSAPVQFGSTPTTASKSFSAPQPQNAPAFGKTPQPQVYEPKPPETKTTIVPPSPILTPQPQVPQPQVPQTQPHAQPKPAPVPQKDQTQQLNAALKAEQELANKHKADLELRDMLIGEVNQFQLELYKFIKKTRQEQIQFHRDLQAITPNTDLQDLDADAIKRECSLEDLRNAIMALKLDLFRANGIVAEARTQSDAKDLDQWTQADPLTTKRVASVKKLSYYVQSQLEQAHRALDYKWNEQVERDLRLKKPGHRMTRPILDDVYQPLVKQQEILSRQQALLRTLRSTLNECQVTPSFRSTSMLRNTPFKNKDPLSKLTKNILNMSIEPQNNENKNLLTPQKLDALRDMLSNHKTVKIKPVNVEMRHHLAAMRMNYEKSLQEQANMETVVVESTDDELLTYLTDEPYLQHGKTSVKQRAKERGIVVETISDERLTYSTVNPTIKSETRSMKQKSNEKAPLVVETISDERLTYSTVNPTIQSETRSMKQKSNEEVPLVVETISDERLTYWTDEPSIQPATTAPVNLVEVEIAPEVRQPTPSFTPIIVKPDTAPPVTRTLFTEGPVETPKPTAKPQVKPAKPQAEPANRQAELAKPQVELAKPQAEPAKRQAELAKRQAELAKPQPELAKPQAEPAKPQPELPKPQAEPAKPQKPAEPQAEPAKPQAEPAPPLIQTPAVPKQPLAFAAPPAAADVTRSVLKDLLQNQQLTFEPKNDDASDTFMGQKICSPSSGFNFSSVIVATPTSFTSKPISELNNMFNKFAPQSFVPETKSSETGEPVSAVRLKADAKGKEDKPMSNLFAMKTSTPLQANAQNVPDVLAGNLKTFTFKRIEPNAETKPEPKPEKVVEKSKENVREKASENVILSIPKISKEGRKENEPTPLNLQNTNTKLFGFNTQPLSSSASAFTSSISDEVPKPIAIKSDAKTEAPKGEPKSEAAPASSASVFASATITVPKPQFVLGSSAVTSTTPAVVSQSVTIAKPQPTSSASSIFATAFASSPLTFPTKTEPASIFSTAVSATTVPSMTKTESGSIFAAASATSTPSSVFGTSPTSIFGTPTATKSSMFATPSTTEAKPAESVFSSTASAPSSVFGSTAKSVFGSSAFATPTTTAAPVFSAVTSTPSSVIDNTISTPSTIGAATETTQTTATTTQSSVFSTPTTASSPIFGSATSTTQPSVFGGTQTSVFGTPQTSQASIFASPATTPSSVFGSSATTRASVFGSATTQASSVFGSPATTQSSVFGAPQTTQASVFGSPQTTQASVFGSPTTQSSVFGTPTQTNQTSVFGTPSQTSVFGATPTQASVFGTPTQSNQASVFGTPTQTTQASVFGTPPPATQASVFGTPTPTTQASVFGSPSQTSVFGAPVTTASDSLFGGGESLFASVNISTTSAPTQSSESIFGGGASGTSVFGSSNNNVFGGKSTFGQPSSQASAIFGAASTFGQTAAAPAANFWGSNNNSGGGFGSTGFGQQPTTQASSVFGTGSFSSPAPSGQAFGGGDSKPFGSPTPQTGGFGSGFGAKAVFGQAAGFGSPTSSGFGASATFGGFNKSPGGFGASATFGGGAAFGGSAFGGSSPGSMFGGAAPQPGFGSPTQSNATFESLATQNTLTFGNLAQQTSQQAQPAPTFNTSPSFTGWRG